MMANFQNRLIFLIFRVFSTVFLHRTTLNHLQNGFWHFFFEFWIFDPKWWFCKGYRLCMMPNFQIRRISRIFSAFSSGFLHRTTLNHLQNGFWHFFFWILNFWPKVMILQRLYIGFAQWQIFQIISFSQYLAFFRTVFTCRMDFDMFFGILIFDPKWRFSNLFQ